MIEAQELEKGNKEILFPIYTDKNNFKQTVFEYSSRKSNCDTYLIKAQISDNRSKWMRLCIAHKVEELVNIYYSSNTIYYNHKPLVIGTKDLIKEYSYMNRENYSLSLNSIFIEVVNDETVFEIGQCEGLYGGNYILIWKKDDDGKWFIFIDSNI